MATVTFYTHVAAVMPFACRLVQKAWASGSRVLVWLEDESARQSFDALLWSFEAASFVPHTVWLPEETTQPPIGAGVALACGTALPPLAADTVVLNLADVYWCDAPQPPLRVLEIIGDDLDELAAARNRFRAYKQAGFAVQHHNRTGKDG